MFPIIEKGFLYIAQPPLYRVKKGKKDTYLKNDLELAEHLLNLGLENLEIKSAGKTLKASELKPAMRAAIKFTKAIERLAIKYHPSVLRSLVFNEVDSDALQSKDKPEKVFKEIEGKIKEEGGLFKYEFTKDDEHNAVSVKMETFKEGVRRNMTLDREMLESPEYEELVKYFGAMKSIGKHAFEVNPKDSKNEDSPSKMIAGDWEQLATQVLEMAKSGLTVQRYKGLGEMNPEQLWETSMDPSIRTFLRVTVEDAVGADNIFSILMGDQVEPRRQFIEENALRVRNLDV
jgi:DNA gyrase subunit B